MVNFINKLKSLVKLKLLFLHHLFLPFLFQGKRQRIKGTWSSNKDHRYCNSNGLGSNLLASLCCVLGKNTLQHYHLLGGLNKQFYISYLYKNAKTK